MSNKIEMKNIEAYELWLNERSICAKEAIEGFNDFIEDKAIAYLYDELIALRKSKDLDKQNGSLEAALRPAIEYLKGCHPHCSIIVTSLHAELLEGVEVINEQGKDYEQ